MRIHQGKVCKKKKDVQKCRSSDHRTLEEVNPLDSNHSEIEPSNEQEKIYHVAKEKKPKIKWPKGNEAAVWKKFDDDVSRVVTKMKGTIERKLEKLAEVIHGEGEDRFGLENERGKGLEKQDKAKKGLSRREEKIIEVKREKKRLRTLWLRADEEEKIGLKVLYEEIKKKHRELLRRKRNADRKRERKRCRKGFTSNPYQFGKGLFDENKSGKLTCSKEDLEKHLKETYTDLKRNEELPYINELKKPTSPGVKFNLENIKKKELDDFIKKTRAKSAPGNDGVSYKVYKYCPKLRTKLFLLIKEMWHRKDVAERWCIAEGLYLPKEADSKVLGQFRPVSLLNIDGKIMFGILAKRIIKFVTENGYINESNQKAGLPGIPGCVEHAYSIWNEIQEAKRSKNDLSVIWLDLANAYGSIPHILIDQAMEFFHIPPEVRRLVRKYYDQFKMRFTTGSFTTEWQKLEVGIAAGCTISVILFVLVMEMLLKSCKCDDSVISTPMRSFMDDITVLSKDKEETRNILERLDELITWSRMKFKAKKSRSLTLVKGVQKEEKYLIGNEEIPTVKEMPVKSLGRWLYEGTLKDSKQGRDVYSAAEEGLKAIDKTPIPGK